VTLLQATGLRVRLESNLQPQSRIVLDGLDLSLAAGDLRGVVGPSGSGKSTLLRALAGFVALDRGDVILDGRSMDDWEPAVWRRHVGLLPQRPVMFPGTVADNLACPAALQSHASDGAPGPEPAAVLEAVGLAATLLDRPAAELSEGQAARVGLVRAVMAGPSVLLLDEPTAALDEDSAKQVATFLRSLCEGGMAVLWVLHDPRLAAALPAEPLRIEPRGDG
jgi:putative ABC transport system ATP-binding protein